VAGAILDGMGSQNPPQLSLLARLQGGLVSRRQALDSGLSAGAIVARLKYGKWRQIYWGVYATFSGPENREGELWAAVLYAGKGARLSHETAAELHGLIEQRTPLVHVTIPASRRVRPTRNIVIHISAHDDWTPYAPGALPCTCVEETVLDLVHSARDRDDACGWVTAAFRRRLTGQGQLRAAMRSRKRLRWRRQLSKVITAAAGGAHSVLEYRYDRDVEHAHGLPPARCQVPFTKPNGRTGFRDRYYAEYALVIELDGKVAHPEETIRQDNARDNDATAHGGSTMRYDWDDVTQHACATAAQVADALHARGWTGALRPCSPGCRAWLKDARQPA
jgi:hypothetical protein